MDVAYSKRRQIFLLNKKRVPQQTLEFKLNISRQTYSFDAPLNLEEYKLLLGSTIFLKKKSV